MAKTGDIKDFVIIEEGGIAKGIRRIIAVTGEEAHAVTRVADEFAARLESIANLSDKNAKDASLKAFSVELARLEISVLRKAAINERFAIVRKALDTELKAKGAADTKLVQDAITQHFKDEPNATVVIRKFDVGANVKALQAGITVAKKLNKAAYLFSEEIVAPVGADRAAKAKVPHVNFVPKQDSERGLDAKEWADLVTRSVGGKGGGKSDGAQGVGEVGGEALQDAITAAGRFYVLKTAESSMPMQ